MKTIITVCLFSLFAVALARPSDEKYTNKYDTVNVHEVLSNDRLFNPYVNCILDKGKCAPDAKELKEHIKEALETYCEKCTDAQKDGTRTVIGHLINEKPELWQELSTKYDPDKKYTTKYEDELRKIKAN